MNTAPIIARLRDQCTGFKFIGGAMDLSESTLQAVNFPAAFVLPISESDSALGTNTQEQVWAIVTAIKAVRTAAVDQSSELSSLREQIKAALLAWRSDTQTSPTVFSGGQLESVEAGALIWIDQYTCTKYQT